MNDQRTKEARKYVLNVYEIIVVLKKSIIRSFCDTIKSIEIICWCGKIYINNRNQLM